MIKTTINMDHARTRIKWSTFLFLFIISSLSINAQTISFTAQAPSAIENGKTFSITYSLNQQGEDISLPEIPSGIKFLTGPQSSSSFSTSYVNGKVEKRTEIKYIYYFQPTKEGKYTIQGATIKVNNKTYTSNSVTIQVVKASSNYVPNQGGSSQGNNQQATTSNNQISLVIYTDKKEAYVGEPIVATVKLFSRVEIEDYGSPKLPDYQGFYKQEIPHKPKVELETIKGVKHLTVVWQRVLLFPQQAGEIIIKPADLTVYLLKRSSRSVWGFGEKVPQPLKSNSLKLKIKPVPQNSPRGYKGAVGDFKLTASVNKTEAKTNDALTFKVQLKGSGNIKLVQAPKLNMPPDFEVYEPKLIENISNSIAGQSGTKTFEYIAIPRYAGSYRIPSVTLSYFNPKTKSFNTLKTKEFNLKISKGDDSLTSPVMVGLSKEDIEFIGSDIRYIKSKTQLITVGEYFFGSTLYFLLFPIILIIMILIVVIRRKQVKNNRNAWKVKNKKANKQAKKRLKQASSHLKAGIKESFYEEMAKALWGYIGDKLSIPYSELTKDRAKELLVEKNIENDLTEDLLAIIDQCEFARYAPAGGESAMKEEYEKAVKIISKIEQKIR